MIPIRFRISNISTLVKAKRTDIGSLPHYHRLLEATRLENLRLNTMSNKRVLPGEAKKDANKRSGKVFPLTQKEIKLPCTVRANG